jgi:hypothetical protein
MYNFRILIQEIQLFRGSLRIYVLIAHDSVRLGTATKTGQSRWWDRVPELLQVGYSGLCLTLMISLDPGSHFTAGSNFV